MANIEVDAVDGLRAREVMHAQTSALGTHTTVAEARAYFAASASRRLAVLAEDGRYLGAVTAAELPGSGDPARRVLEIAIEHPTVTPDAPARLARDLAMASDTRRVPVVGEDGRYLGVVSVNRGLEWFCGTG